MPKPWEKYQTGPWDRYKLPPPAEFDPAANPAEYDPASPEFQAKYGGLAGSSGTSENVRAGFGKAFTDLGRGAQQLTGAGDTAEIARSRELDAPLMASKAGMAGNIAGNVAAAVPAMAIPGAASIPGAAAVGAGVGALQPAVSGQERAINVGAGGALGAAGQKVGQGITSALTKKLAEREATQAALRQANAIRDATLREGHAAGYVVPPTTSNPTMLNRVLEGAAGKLTTAQAASVKNQKVTNKLASRAVGLPDNAPLSRKALDGVRKQAGKVYEQIGKAGEIIPDQQYAQELNSLMQEASSIAQSFPDLNVSAAEQVQTLSKALLRPKFDAKSAQEAVKQLRKQAADNLSPLASLDPSRRALGGAQREAAGTLEDMILRHLRASGEDVLADSFDEARKTIAKSYTVQNALNEATGNVNAINLAGVLRKGKPLSGELEVAAKFAAAFPKASRETTESMPGISPLDFYASGGASWLSANPAPLAYPIARMGARAALTSPFGQKLAMPSYQPGLGGTLGYQGMKQIGRYGMPISVGGGLAQFPEQESFQPAFR